MHRHIMVDSETLGLSPDSVIVSIGAVVFTEQSGIEAEGSWTLHLDQPGRHVDLGTIKWWMTQGDAARKVFADKDTTSLSEALTDLGTMFDNDTRIWSNGANFDEVLLADAYKSFKRRTPWSYKNVRCYRTIRAMYPEIDVIPQGTAHNALDDARYQTQVLLEIAKQKGLVLP